MKPKQKQKAAAKVAMLAEYVQRVLADTARLTPDERARVLEAALELNRAVRC